MKRVTTTNQNITADIRFKVDAFQVLIVNHGTASIEIFIGQIESSTPLATGESFGWSTGNPEWIDESTIKIEFGAGIKDVTVLRTVAIA